jgi:hypothetical protein
MFFSQVQRVKNNILPFALIGLCVGIVIGKASWFRSFRPIREFFDYAGIYTRYPDSGQGLFFDHFNEDTLTLLLVVMFLLSALSRLVLGIREKFPEDSRGNIHTLDNFGSLLAIAWMGLMLGISVPVFALQGFSSFAKFIVYIVYPLVFLIEVKICTAFLSGNSLYAVHNMAGGHRRPKLGIRAEGLVVLILAILMLTFQSRQYEGIELFVNWIQSLV